MSCSLLGQLLKSDIFPIFQVKRVVDSDEYEEDEKEETDKCTICLSEFVEDEDVRYVR